MGLTPSLDTILPDATGEEGRKFYAMRTDIREKAVVWITTRRADVPFLKRDGSPYLDEDGEPLTVGIYHIQGVFTEENLSVAACRDATYLVGPLPLNLALPHDPVPWPGAYFPLKAVESTKPE